MSLCHYVTLESLVISKTPHPIEQDPPPDERRGFPLVPYLGVFLGYIHFFVYFCTINKWKWDARSKILV